MAKKSDSFYFGNFYACADCAYQAAHLLERVMRDFDPLLIREKLDDMHKVEHAADEKKHEVLDALVTNFHLPQSTLIMLVSALAGREHVLSAYEEAVKERYRFFSFGDAMFIGDVMPSKAENGEKPAK